MIDLDIQAKKQQIDALRMVAVGSIGMFPRYGRADLRDAVAMLADGYQNALSELHALRHPQDDAGRGGVPLYGRCIGGRLESDRMMQFLLSHIQLQVSAKAVEEMTSARIAAGVRREIPYKPRGPDHPEEGLRVSGGVETAAEDYAGASSLAAFGQMVADGNEPTRGEDAPLCAPEAPSYEPGTCTAPDCVPQCDAPASSDPGSSTGDCGGSDAN